MRFSIVNYQFKDIR